MWTTLLSGSFLFVGSVAGTPDKAYHYYEYQLETRRYCIEGLRDAQGRPPPCSQSIATKTAGLTLPGMDDGALTTKSHVMIGSDGSETTVEAHPSYPYQYFMRTSSESSVTMERLINGEAVFIGSVASEAADTLPISASDSMSLEDDGWTFRGAMEKDGVRVNEWVKKSFQGVDHSSGFNYTFIYMANLAPDTWNLYMDRNNEKPLKIVATNAMHGHAIHQEMTITNFEKKDGFMPSEQAHQRFYDLYQINTGGAPMSASGATTAEQQGGTFSAMRESLLSGHIPSDPDSLADSASWLSRRHLRSSQVIPYFTVEDGTAASVYFERLKNPPRQLLEYQYPKGCAESDDMDGLCTTITLDASLLSSFATLDLDMQLPDVKKKGRTAQLSLTVELSLELESGNLALDLYVEASGCALVFQLGGSVAISVTVCLEADGDAEYDDKAFTFSAYIPASVTFGITLPVVGNIIDVTIDSKIECNAGNNNHVRAYGNIGTSADAAGIASASIKLDILAVTVDNNLGKWQMSSNVRLSAKVSTPFFSPTWGETYTLWSYST
ncbi:hypothetical protein FOZ61_004644 [Perkinsus olseni]|uniref:Protein arginine methyltransferase 10 n=1 Tax=Perkinsus olseni TaxID=32597 RepID=A0A7J6LW95_PEROL|nr:hypothetical protein FOZ61_004644 [Perkinsus olseni]KAF4663592.1 hypothetical protein FOL46_004670 [Perkinsus olseni]